MTWWLWVAFCWLATGAATVFVLKVTDLPERIARSYNSLFLNTLLRLIISILTVAVMPCCVLMMAAEFIWDRWGWEDPRPDDRAWPLSGMIGLRFYADGSLRRLFRRRGSPLYWPEEVLAETTEAMILDAVERYYWLRDAGLTEENAVEQMEVLDRGISNSQRGKCMDLRTFIDRRLEAKDPRQTGSD